MSLARALTPFAMAMLLASPSLAATIYVEDWNTDGAGSRYIVIGGGSANGGTDAWALQSTVALWTFTGSEGEDYWLGRDLNGDFGGDANPRVVDVAALSPVDTSGYSGIHISLLLGAVDGVFESGEADYLRITAYDTVTGVSQLLDEFLPNGRPDSDLMGSLSGITLGLEMQDITYDVTAPITSLAIRIEAYNGRGGREGVAFDFLRVTGTQLVVPEPSVASMLGMGLLGLAMFPRLRRH